MDYKARIIAGLDYLDKLGGEGATVKLRKQLNEVKSESELFYMHQSMREIIAKGLKPSTTQIDGETAELNTGFKVKLKNGSVINAESLDDAKEKIRAIK